MNKNWLGFMTGLSAVLMAFPVDAQQINFEKEELKNKFQEVSREELSEFMKNIK